MRRILDLIVNLVAGLLAPPGAHPIVSTGGAGARRRRRRAARRR